MNLTRLLPLALIGLLAQAARAQNTIELTADVTQADGVAMPTLTWSTTPPAGSCFASGQWSGEKGPAGSETLPATTQSATYNLSCSWPGDTTATLSWINPTTNTDGSPYTDPGSIRIDYGVDGALDQSETLTNPLVMSRVIEDLPAGEWCFVAFAVNARGVASVASNTACKTITGGASASESIGVVVNPVPSPITGLGVN